MIRVEGLTGKPVAEQKVEVVERKGVGHPDYICDAVMEAISVALAGEYRRAFGTVLHHNIDKGLLAAGRVRKRFGGGEVTKPMELTIGDRATFRAGKKSIPVGDIAIGAAKRWIWEHLRFLDPERHVKYRLALVPGSEELTDIFQRPGEHRGANDTSALVGYYPLSPTERAVLALERHLNSREFKERYPETGEDVKVMGHRLNSGLHLTVAMPLIARFIPSEDEYFKRKEAVEAGIRKYLRRLREFEDVSLTLNALDAGGRGLSGVYLSVLGTSAEDADSGQVGRGNRANGLITMNRPMSTEAAAGKNAVSHVGKIYNVLAHRLAERIYREVEGLREVYVILVSRIGMPVDTPLLASAQMMPERGRRLPGLRREAARIIEAEFSDIGRFCEQLAEGKFPVC